MPQEPHRATARCLDILEYLAAAGAGCTLTELSEALGAPKSSLFPILHTLADRKYVHLEDGKYTVGIGAFTLGATYSAGRNALELILTVMAQVVEECQETCQLAVRDQGNVLYIGKVDSPQAIRMISHVGTRLPANATALGKALLSGLTDQEVAALYSGGLPRLTEHTITDLSVLLGQLSQIRGGGVAWEREESNHQLGCYAVPLRQKGKVFAAISVTVPLFRSDPNTERTVRESLLRAQTDIERLATEKSFHLERLAT